jgi:quercetin dioxygenase-like cupin family protein/hemerythrin-like domain-containing protein
MPTAISVLIDEHDECRRRLESAQSSLVVPVSAANALLEEIRELLNYLETELETHITKEEVCLFPRLKSALPPDDRLIDEMIAEHDLVRIKRGDIQAVLAGLMASHDDLRLNRARFRSALTKGRQSQAGLQQAVAIVAEKLRVHFQNEEELVFPLATRHLSVEELNAITIEMQEIDAGARVGGPQTVEARNQDITRQHDETSVRLTRFEDAIAEMKQEPAWLRGDRTARTVVKESGLSVVLTIMKAGAELQAHRADGSLTIQCLSGHVRFFALQRRIELWPGDMAALAGGVEHSVEAEEESAFLLTIAAAS